MNADPRAIAESHLAEAAANRGFADPRPPYRERLRTLRQSDRSAFDRAVAHYEETTLPGLAGDDPLAAWLEYGRFLAGLTTEGAVTLIDQSGRALPVANAADADALRAIDSNHAPPLVLFIPTDNSADVLTLLVPGDPTPAQRATLSLLVDRKLSLA